MESMNFHSSMNFYSSMKKWGNIFNLIKNAEIYPTFVRKQWKTSELIFLRKNGDMYPSFTTN